MAWEIIYKDVAPLADDDASFSAADKTAFSTLDFTANEQAEKKITLEKNLWLLDGEYETLRDDSVHYWSESVSDDDTEFTVNPSVDVIFTIPQTSVGITLTFDEANGGYPAEIDVEWFRGGNSLGAITYYPDAVRYFCENAQTYDRIVITIKKTNVPVRRARLSRIVFGIIRSFGMDKNKSVTITNQMDLTSASLPASSLNWQFESAETVDFLFQKKQPIEIQSDNGLVGVYYINNSERVSENGYKITAYDAIGALGEQMFDGGVWRNGISAKTLLNNVVDGAFSIVYSDGLQDKTLYGLLERQTKREAIQQILFAWGVCCATDGSSGLTIFALQNNPYEIGAEKTYIGGSVVKSAVVSSVSVVGHDFFMDDNGRYEVNGVKYGDVETIYTAENSEVLSTDVKNDVYVDRATLVDAHNAQGIANSLLAHYKRRDTQKNKIIYGGERLGDAVTMWTPWGTQETGNVKSINISLSGVVAANIEAVGVET